MEFGPAQIQIFVSLGLILGASLVALVCDYLKGHNEQLRELTVELKVRGEESEKLIKVLESKDSASQAAMPIARQALKTRRVSTEPQEEFSPARQISAPEPERALSRAEAPAGREAVSRVSREAVAAIVRGAKRAQRQETPKPEATPPSEILKHVVDAAVARRETAAPPIGARPASVKKDWNSLLASRPKPAKSAEPSQGLLDRIVAATAVPIAAPLPEGIQMAGKLKQLSADGYKVSGLVVSIEVTSPSCAESQLEFAIAAQAEIKALLQPGEFAASTGPNEFVLIAPAARGAAAQRRLSRITQQLWDVQLASLGQFELQFTWGGLEVRDEPIEDAIDSAMERAQETRHTRGLMTLTSARQPLRKAV